MFYMKSRYNCPQGILFQPVKNKWEKYWSASPSVFNNGLACGVNFKIGY